MGTVFLLGCVPVLGQDTHYWTNQYGPRGELLGGLVVGAFTDLSATYYNPAATAVANEPILNLTTAAYQLVSIGLKEEADRGLDLGSTRVRRIPSIIAFQLPVGDNRHRFAGSVLTRSDFKFTADQRDIDEYDGSLSGGDSLFSGEAMAEYSLSESWGGVTWGFPLAPRIGFGVTTYAAVRSQSTRQQIVGQTFDAFGGGEASIQYADISYWNARLLWKLGIVADLTPLTVGLALTTPSINLFGNGRVSANDGLVLPAPNSSLAASSQRDLPSTYKSSVAVAAGGSYTINRTSIYVSCEWFNGVSEYAVLDAAEFVGQTSGETYSIDVLYELAPVMNWGVAIDHELGESVDLYAAFITDHSALDDPEGTQRLALTGWDIRQVTVGSAFTVGTFGLTTGFSFGWGDERYRSAGSFRESAPPSELHYRSYKVLLGFEFTL
jgi:hypothetical protein